MIAMMKQIKTTYKDAMKFADKHPVVALAIGTLATLQAVQIFAGGYFFSKEFQRSQM